MSLDSFEFIVEFTKLIHNIVGKKHPITINSGIVAHCNDINYDINEDLYIINGSPENPITIMQIVKVMKNINKQLWKYSNLSTIFDCYDNVPVDLSYDNSTETYTINWLPIE